MDEPVWIPLTAFTDIHRETIALHGGAAGVADAGLLESAGARARNRFLYAPKPPGLPALAAVYGYGLCRNHPFVDGNKRVAFLAICVFLDLNGWYLDAPELDAYETMMAVAEGVMDEDGLADWIRRWARPVE